MNTPLSVRAPLRICRDALTSEIFAEPIDAAPATGGEIGVVPPLYPEWLGDPGFLRAHGVRFPYVTGSMANGIATPRMVVKVANAGMLGFFGSAGLSVQAVEAGLDEIVRHLDSGSGAWGRSPTGCAC